MKFQPFYDFNEVLKTVKTIKSTCRKLLSNPDKGTYLYLYRNELSYHVHNLTCLIEESRYAFEDKSNKYKVYRADPKWFSETFYAQLSEQTLDELYRKADDFFDDDYENELYKINTRKVLKALKPVDALIKEAIAVLG